MNKTMIAAIVAVAASAGPGCVEEDPVRADECGLVGAACCLEYPDNDTGYQYTCQVGAACLAGTCVATAGGVHWATLIASSALGDSAHRDPDLDDPWGVVGDVHGELFVANRGRRAVTGYDGVGRPRGVVAKLDAGPLAGISARQLARAAFMVDLGGSTAPADFLWAHDDGRISASRIGAPGGKVVVERTGARFTGLALLPADADADASAVRLYAVDRAGGKVEILDGNLRPVQGAGFTAPGLAPLVPYGIAAIDGHLWVSYAEPLADGSGGVRADRGRVVIFDRDGALVEELPGSEALAAPWGMAQAPDSGFGDLNGCGVVASSGSGRLDAWCRDGDRHVSRGPLLDEAGQPVVIEGVRGIAFSGGGGGEVASLYATARRLPTVGGGLWAVQWGVLGGRPTWHVCMCDCVLGADVTWSVGYNLFVNDLQFPGACAAQCDAIDSPPGAVCTR